MAQRAKRVLDWDERRVKNWVDAKRGILTRIAVDPAIRCSPQFVQAVAYGRSTARPGQGSRLNVERMLRAAGWPGIKKGRLK